MRAARRREHGAAMSIDPVVYARRWKTLGVLALSLIIIGLDNTILNVALPSLQEAFDASSSTLQWIVDAYLLVFAGLLLTMGTVGDRFGRKPALQVGLVLFGGASLFALWAQNSTQLIVIRSVMGVGGALIMPATLSIITNTFPREERGKAIGVWAAMASVGIGLGPLVGGFLLEYFDWSSVFMVNVPIAGLALALGIWWVPDSRDPRPGAFDVPGAALSVSALTALVYAIVEAPDRGWGDPRVLCFFGAAATLGFLFVRWELHTPEPMLNLEFFRDRRFSMASAGISLASFALFGTSFANTQFLQDAHGYSALQAGAGMVPMAVGLMVGSMSSVRLVARIGAAKVISAGLLLLAALLVSTLAWAPDMPYWIIGVWFLLIAMAMGLVMAPATDSVMGSVPEEKAGVASAMNDVTRQVGGALGTAVIGSLITSLYASRIADSVSALPESARSAVKDSIGKANVVAAHLPGAAGDRLAHDAADAFTHAMGIGFGVSAALAVAAAVAVWRWLPARSARAEIHVGAELPAPASS
jgi:EmrB/QacA subfamily drug resistance transporter